VSSVRSVTMPKWGLSMKEGRVARWLVDEGAHVKSGDELVEIETDKILGSLEAPASGVLVRKVGKEGSIVPVAGLLGVIAETSVPEAEIDAFIAEFQAEFVPEAAEREASGPAPQTVEIQGQSLRYLRRGEGEQPAVLLHGFGGDLNSWLFNHEVLAAHRAVYALDLPGHGGSSKQVGTGILDQFTGVVISFMDALGLPRVHLLGHSMGGAVAVQVALTQPRRVASLTLIASAALGAEINGEYVEGFIRAGRRKELTPQVEKLFADPKLASRQMVEDILKYKRLDGVQPALRSIADELFPRGQQATVLRDRLGELSMPVLVVWGGNDRILPVSQAQGLPQNVTVEIFPESGHMAHMEAPKQFNQLVSAFWHAARRN
jgi:pyruvate dehydrogenase E2 component (dihydrolipoamide acetyltransferase)